MDLVKMMVWQTHLDGGLLNSQRACDLCCSSTIDDAIVAHEVADYAERVM